MKKLYILVIAMISVSSLFAQNHSRNDYGNDGYRNDNKQWGYSQQNNGRNDYRKDGYDKNNQQPVYNQQNKDYNDRNYLNNDHYYNGQQQQMQERDRRAAIDRVNHDYDQRINMYRNDRSLNGYERNRRIAQAQRERQQKIGSFGKGIITGAIVGVIAGVLLSK